MKIRRMKGGEKHMIERRKIDREEEKQKEREKREERINKR